MRKLHYIIPLLINMFISTKNSKAQVYQSVLSQDPIYQLNFIDEFDALAIDTHKWTGRYYGWAPNQPDSSKWFLTYYGGEVDQDYNSTLFDGDPYTNRGYDTIGTGYTKLITRYHPTTVTGYIWDFSQNPATYVPTPFKFSTAILYSRFNFRFCYMEIRFRTDNYAASSYNAYSPNFWMWNSDDTASYSELDMSEINGNDWTTSPCAHYQHRSTDTVSWDGNSFYPNTYAPYLRHHSSSLTPGQWHTIGCEWTPEYADFYYYSLSADTFQRFGVDKYPIDKLTQMPLIIDNYTPAPRDNFIINFDPAHTTMPFSYDVDYVKVWQVRQNCISQSFLNIASAGAYTSTLYKDLTIGGSGSTGCNFTSGNTHLAGNDFVILQDGFEVSGNSTVVLINTMKCQTNQTLSHSLMPPNPPTPLTTQQKNEIKRKMHQ